MFCEQHWWLCLPECRQAVGLLACLGPAMLLSTYQQKLKHSPEDGHNALILVGWVAGTVNLVMPKILALLALDSGASMKTRRIRLRLRSSSLTRGFLAYPQEPVTDLLLAETWPVQMDLLSRRGRAASC